MAKATRVVVDCRNYPSASKECSLSIAGTEEEVMKVAVRHAVEEHGHKDSPELRNQIQAMFQSE